MVWWVCLLAMSAYRASILIGYHSWDVSTVLFVAAEGLALILGVWNGFAAKSREGGWNALFVPVLYVLLALCWVPGSVGVLGASFALAGFLLRKVAMLYLGVRFSTGGLAWVSLVDRGPYRIVRHPQSLGRLLMFAGNLIDNPSHIGYVLAGVVLIFVLVAWEEDWLSKSAEWSAYADRVPYRLLAGVW